MQIYSFDEYKHKESQLKRYEYNMMGVVCDYINFNSEFRNKHKINFEIKEVVNVYDSSLKFGGYIIKYKTPRYDYFDLKITTDEYNDIVEFMKDPELYKSKTKHNL